MRLVMVNAPAGLGDSVAKTAFSSEIKKVSRRSVESQHADGKVEHRDVVDIETSTPKARRFLDLLLASDFYDAREFTISIRSPVSIISQEDFHEITKPLKQTVSDIFEDLYQFSHITYSFVGRILIAAGLLGYGMVHQKMLIMIAGLLFLPLLPLLQAIGFGALTRHGKLSVQGLTAFVLATILLVLGGVIVGALSSPPIRYDEFNTLGVSLLISALVGVAAGLAIIDDAGKREMIGLAASAQIAIVPVWFGLCLTMGFPATASESEITTRAVSFPLNVLTIVVAAGLVHFLTGSASPSFKNARD